MTKILETKNFENENLNLDSLYKELHSICSYLAMFPAKVPREYIEKYTKENDIVYDPFSGRGTTTLEAIRLNRRAFSNDLSPLAFVLTKAKTFPVSIKSAKSKVKKLEKEYKEWDSKIEINFNNSFYKEIGVFYSKNNLKQLIFLREKIGKNWSKNGKVDNYILAILLGIFHGKTKVDGTSSYLSVSMPNGYSMSPNYAKNYIAKNNLKLIENNVFEKIIERIEKKPNFFIKNNNNKVFNKDALTSSKFIRENPKLIFTSPPYLNIVKYVSQNWIKFWLLGFEKEQTKENIVDDFHNVNSYEIFLTNFLIEMEKIMNKETILVLVIGDVKNFYINNLMDKIIPTTNFYYKEEPHFQVLSRKLSNQMGTKKGNATPKDWIFVLQKNKTLDN